jgi:hypothetical protein
MSDCPGLELKIKEIPHRDKEKNIKKLKQKLKIRSYLYMLFKAFIITYKHFLYSYCHRSVSKIIFF